MSIQDQKSSIASAILNLQAAQQLLILYLQVVLKHTMKQ